MNNKMIEADGKFYKKHQVVMLAVDVSNVVLTDGKLRITPYKGHAHQVQHFYILSDEKPSSWDAIVDGSTTISPYSDCDVLVDYRGKVIATTDSLLGLPRPSDAFVQKYVEEYNKGNVITEVLVEYYDASPDMSPIYLIKTAPDNTITIKPVAETWDDIYSRINTSEFNSKIEVFKWLKENYQVPKIR